MEQPKVDKQKKDLSQLILPAIFLGVVFEVGKTIFGFEITTGVLLILIYLNTT